jgi:hypothetical protein
MCIDFVFAYFIDECNCSVLLRCKYLHDGYYKKSRGTNNCTVQKDKKNVSHCFCFLSLVNTLESKLCTICLHISLRLYVILPSLLFLME